MSELLDFYQRQATGRQSQISWLARMQENALADFTRLGFPTRHHEDWKYTAIQAMLQQRFTIDTPQKITPEVYQADIPIGHKITLINGVVLGIDTLMTHLPEGVIVQPLSHALLTHAEKIKPYLGHILQHQHGFHALNTAILQNGLFIYLPAGVCLNEPLLLSHWQDEANQATYIRHLVVAETGSRAKIIEDYHGEAGCCYLTNTVTEVYAGPQANIRHYKIQRESQMAYHVGHLAVIQAAESQVESHSFSIGGKLVRSDSTIRLHEPKAHCLLNGLYAPAEGQHIDHHTLVMHEVADCSSTQDYRGILNGQARAVFNGRVIVAKNAQHTQAKQQNKNLLLSDQAEVDTKPQLEIFADDVICTHGATVGQLDEEALFYLAARGIEHSEACGFLIQAFAGENLQALAYTELADWISTLLNQQLG